MYKKRVKKTVSLQNFLGNEKFTAAQGLVATHYTAGALAAETFGPGALKF
jgi:hypothetical protein